MNAMQNCPRFLRCSVPICPLDSLQDYRDSYPGEPKCPLGKSIRHRIGKEAGLERQGLIKSEWAAKLRWESLSEVDRQRRTVHLRQNSANYTGPTEQTGDDNA